jgi:hypothetical protein
MGSQWGSFQIILIQNQNQYRLFTGWTSAYIESYFKTIRRYPPFDGEAKLAEFSERLYAIEGIDPVKEEWRSTYLNVKFETLEKQSRLELFLSLYDWVKAEISSGA